MILFIINVQNKQTHSYRKLINGCQELVKTRTGGMTVNWVKGFFWGDKMSWNQITMTVAQHCEYKKKKSF